MAISCFTVGFVSGVAVSLISMMIVFVVTFIVVIRNKKRENVNKYQQIQKTEEIRMEVKKNSFVLVDEEEEEEEDFKFYLEKTPTIKPKEYEEYWLSFTNQ